MAHNELTWFLSPSNSLSGAQQPCVFKTYKSSKSFADQSRRLFPAALLLLQLCFELFLPALRAERTIAYRKKKEKKKTAQARLKVTLKLNRITGCVLLHTCEMGMSFPVEHNEGMAPEA